MKKDKNILKKNFWEYKIFLTAIFLFFNLRKKLRNFGNTLF